MTLYDRGGEGLKKFLLYAFYVIDLIKQSHLWVQIYDVA